MASARFNSARRISGSPRGSRGLVPGRTRAGRVRWDRVARIALLVVLAGVVYLYIGPAASFVSAWHEAREKRGEVQALKEDNQRLRERQQALKDPKVLEREARKLGMVREGERAYVIQNLPADGR
jgi:cell division protein FtsB